MKWCELFSLYSIVTFVICITRLKCGANYCMFSTTTITRREMMACYAIQSTCVVFILLINPARTENALGYLSVRNPVFVGGNITLMLIPFYHAFLTDIENLKLQVIFRKDSAEKEIHEAIRPFENGKAFFMEIRNVDKTWNNSAVFFKYSNTVSNFVDLTIKDRTEGLLHILSDPSQPEDSAQIAFYPPVGFQDWKQIFQWWSNRYGGNVNDANKEEIIFTIKIFNHRTLFLEYFHKDSPMNISATVVSAHKGVGPPCTNRECGHCVCVHLGEDFTCSTDGRMLAMWIGSENVDFDQIIDTRNEVKQYRPHNGSINERHHNSTIVCFMEKNGFVFNESATLIVLGRPVLSSQCSVDNCFNCLCVRPGDMISCITYSTNVSLWIGNIQLRLQRTQTDSQSTYTTVNYTIREEDHHSIVKCSASYDNKEVVNAYAIVYVYVPPKLKPELFLPELKEGYPVNITCLISQGRPPPVLQLYLEGQKLTDVSQHNMKDTTNRTYTSVATVKSADRMWNNKNITCRYLVTYPDGQYDSGLSTTKTILL
ncbi:uncharacterized protein LOC127873452 isoform X3 [Dreissena polymorpha]|uniref:uncharacterized protein LOC127873452 isoform X3 n=1 Tax=Dreissena polymorpha TaxID=45954 RepID=UPI002264C00E|nr:uncharacterized protein LOC127873452 isoform X3 [Dreissena polymorpha]